MQLQEQSSASNAIEEMKQVVASLSEEVGVSSHQYERFAHLLTFLPTSPYTSTACQV